MLSYDLVHMPLQVILLGVVFFGIAFRKVGSIQLPIWLILLGAAFIVIVTGRISPSDAFHAIDFDVIFYLLGVFVIGQALEESNFLENSMIHILQKTSSTRGIIAILIVSSSIISILLMNDTAAIIGTPAIVLLCKKTKLPHKPLLLTLAFTITISSVTSPIGNPQNLLIANSIKDPFVNFFSYLFIPTCINLILLYTYILLSFRKAFTGRPTIPPISIEVDKRTAGLAKLSISLLLLLIIVKTFLAFYTSNIHIPFGLVALLSASPILLRHNNRAQLLKRIDWHTLIFFLGLFIFIKSVWLSNYFQNLIQDMHLVVNDKKIITVISLGLSQLISNVPLVALYLPMLKNNSTELHMVLSMASTMAGNLLVLGAVSNIIIIQNAEKRYAHAFSFLEFMIYGIPITIVNVIVYLWFL